MTPRLLEILCDPATKQPLVLDEPVYDERGDIVAGTLTSAGGGAYPIINGIPRFVSDPAMKKGVASFGDEWNHFNFAEFEPNWRELTIRHTFGSTEIFDGKVIVDAGGGSGAQTLWMLESGAEHVIMMDLSHSVDDVVQRNLGPSGFTNYDIVQCSIDSPPLKSRSIAGIVICHNVIQHTPSVERTARVLFEVVGPGGEFVFNCYPLNDEGALRWFRFHVIVGFLRGVLRRLPFGANLAYARSMGALRLIPGIGYVAEKVGLCVCGPIPMAAGESRKRRRRRMYKQTVLNTFDYFGSHAHQHHLSNQAIQSLLTSLQPDASRVLNSEQYFRRPPPSGCALRVFR